MIVGHMPISEAVDPSISPRIQRARELALLSQEQGYATVAQYDEFKNSINRALMDVAGTIMLRYKKHGRPDIFFGFGSKEASYFMWVDFAIHTISSSLRRARKDLSNSFLSELAAALAEFEPWTVVAAEMKARIAKRGDARIQSKPPIVSLIPVNSKPRATCPCCFRTQAVHNGRIVAHGYRVDSYVFRSRNCFGTAYEPFEVSCKGTKEFITSLTEAIERYEIKVNETDPNDRGPLSKERGRMINAISSARSTIRGLEIALAKWIPTATH